MFNKIILFFLLFSIANVIAKKGYYQSVAVWGRVLCDGTPQNNIKIKLYERDKYVDDLMNVTRTNCNGVFRLKGSDYENKPMDVRLNIYHHCHRPRGFCAFKYVIKVPKRFVYRGARVKRPYRVGNIRMRSWQKRWGKRDCFH